MSAWEVIYRNKSTEELQAMLVELDALSTMSTQTIGGRSYAVDVAAVKEKMLAVATLLEKRAGSVQVGRGDSVGVVDFSGGVDGSWGGGR